MRIAVVATLAACSLGLGALVPAPAHACGISPVLARLAMADPDGGMAPVPEGADVLIAYECHCSPFEEPPMVEVTDANGGVVPGSASWLDIDSSAGGGVVYARWHAEAELAAGSYTLRWLAPGTAQSDPLPFTVGGEAITTTQLEFDAELGTAVLDAGTLVNCDWSSCGPHVATQQRVLPEVILRPGTDPSRAEAAQFLYRAVALGEDGARAPGHWRVLRTAEEALRVTFEGARDEYCTAVEALRVSDGEVMELQRECFAEALEGLGLRPAPWRECAAVLTYQDAWCEDNADLCTDPTPEAFEACADYDDHCGTRHEVHERDAGARGTVNDAGAERAVNGAGDDVEGEREGDAAVGDETGRSEVDLVGAKRRGCAAGYGTGQEGSLVGSAVGIVIALVLVRRGRGRRLGTGDSGFGFEVGGGG